jgi:signal peptide peptidase SppA
MNSIYLISSILRGRWLIEPSFAESQGPILANFLNRYTEFQKQDADPMSAFAVDSKNITGVRYSRWNGGFNEAPEGSIAIVRLNGPLMKDDQECGPIGMETIGMIIKEAIASRNIDAIVLHIDSPGGTVDGTEALGNIVKGSQKPIVSFVDGLMASAALWIGSSATEVIASTDTDIVGSVGVILSFVDLQPYWEKQGVAFHTIAANTSPDKNKNWEDLRAGKYDDYKKEVLDPLDEKFMNTIRQNRPNVKDEHLTGKIYLARDVMGVFIDSLGTLEDAILRASELAQEQKNSQGSNDGSQAEINNPKSYNMSKKYLNIQGVLGSTTMEFETDGSRTFSEDEMTAVDGALVASNSEELQTQLTAANKTIGQQTATITERENRITELEAENTTLRGQSAGGSANARTSSDDETKPTEPGPVATGSMSLVEAMNAVSEEYLGKPLK